MSAVSNALETASREASDLENDGIHLNHQVTFPDGGLRAWLVVIGAFCAEISTFGFISAWGVFQAYYEQTLLRDRSPVDIAWIGSVQTAFGVLPSVLIGRLFDLGHFELPFLFGSIILAASTIVIAECREHWQFLLVQGVVVGAAIGICYCSLFAVIGHWFKDRRGTALTIMGIGSPVGSMLFPVVARQLIPKVGFPWTMRIIGFIILGLMGIGNLTMRRRLPPKDVAGSLFDRKAFRSPAFTVYCCAAFVMFLGINTVPTFVDSSALSAGISPQFAFYYISILNGSSFIGRMVTALLVDKMGAINMIVPMTSIPVITACIWPHVLTERPLIAISVIYGFASATWFSTFAVPVCNLGNVEDSGRRIGMLLTITSFAAAGPPISGAIIKATGGYVAAGYYAGSVMLLSCCMALTTRHLYLRTLLGKF